MSVNELTEETEIRGFVCRGEIIEFTFEYKDNFNTSKVCNGKGVIYYMKDENGCEAPYDFKSISFNGSGTFRTHHGKIAPVYEYGIQVLNNIVFDFSDDSAYVTIGENCKNLLLKGLSGDITIHSGVQGESAENPTELTLTGNLDVYNKNGEIVIVDKSSGEGGGSVNVDLSDYAKKTDLDDYLPLAGGELTGNFYLSAPTPLIIGKKGKIGLRAATDTNNNVGQMNISNA